MSIMDRAKRTVCNVLGHKWKFYMSVGSIRDAGGHQRAFYCTRCDDRKVVVDGVTLEGQDAKEVIEQMNTGMRAVMDLLDNVEPTCSAETVDGKVVVKINGEIVGERSD